jgi:hypothetical protein
MVLARRDNKLEHQFALDCRLSIIIGKNSCFERSVIFGVLQRADHGLDRVAMMDGVAAGTLFAFLRNRTRTLASVAPWLRFV